MTNLYADPTIGTVLSFQALSNEKFVVGKVLKGGMGTVYQLVPVRPFEFPPVALKTYQESADRRQFIREAEVWISLGTHPHVAHALAYTEWRSHPSVFAEWYDKSLAETDIRGWPSSKIVTFALQLADGLRYAVETANVVHQDIKPSNVLLDDSCAPRITDFGLARFAPNKIAHLGRIQDVQPKMSHAVSLGDLGGTPLYMAPELFLGARPSIRTDIFSLGVTLYEALIRQHPFIGAETGHRWRPLLRDAPIRLALKERGDEIKPLVLLIVAALELNPERRPASYPALFAEAGLRSPKPTPPRSDVALDDLVAKAVMLREQGRHQEALVLLRKAMEERPTNPLLLNSYAILLKSLGKHTEARDAWKLAVESLAFTSGRHEHRVYLDPALNLAGQMISAKEFKEAEALLRSAQQWANGRTPLLNYVQFGWWHLYKGRFADACNAILAAYKSKAPDEASLLWLTLAAWLSGRFEELATKLAEYYLMLPRLDVQTALCACVVASHCRQPEATKLFDAAYRDSEFELDAIAKDLGLQPPIFKPPLHAEVSKTTIRSLDVMLTAGKYSELIG